MSSEPIPTPSDAPAQRPDRRADRAAAADGQAPMKQVVRWFRLAAQRGEHVIRRNRLRRQLARAGVPRSVLFVCQGNMYRSPFAAAVFAARLPHPFNSTVSVLSAGFERPGRPCPERATSAASRHATEMGDHRSTLLTAELVRDAELIVVMDPRHQQAICRRFRRDPASVIILGDLDPRTPDTRAIPDPVGRPDHVLNASYSRIYRCTLALVLSILPRNVF